LPLFHEWFAFRFYDLVSDREEESLAHHEMDESFVNECTLRSSTFPVVKHIATSRMLLDYLALPKDHAGLEVFRAKSYEMSYDILVAV
jgi:hypothetical protein